MRDLVLFYFTRGGARLNTDQLATQTDKDWSTGRPTCLNHQVSIVRDDDHQDNDEHDPDKHRETSTATTMDVTVKLSSKQIRPPRCDLDGHFAGQDMARAGS